jgi:hypothetical protein
MPLTGETIRANIERYLNDTMESRAQSELCRDYYDGKQWTDEEVATLKTRHQAPIVVNRIKPKVQGLVGLWDLRSSDPKAYPRTRKHEDAGHVVTDGLRFVKDNTEFSETRLDVAEEFFVEGYAGAIVDFETKGGEQWIRIKRIPWDRIYFDPKSRELNFSDSTYFGVILWMYREQAEEKYPDFDFGDAMDNLANTDETFQDRPKWVDKTEDRVRIAMHFERYRGQWHVAVVMGDLEVIPAQVSPYLDADGEPSCPIELVASYVDRDNDRYSEVKDFLDLQDEINHRRSKSLHNLNSRQTFDNGNMDAEKVRKNKRELKKPDGHLAFDGDQFGKDFGLLPPQGETQGHFEFYQDAKAEMDAKSFNAQLAGERQSGDLSGKAISRLQQAGTIELNRLYSRLVNWEYRIYNQVWSRIKQSWSAEKWVRITDDHDALRWVGFNIPITMKERLEEVINDESQPIFDRRQAAMLYTQMIQNRDPRLEAMVETRNPIPELAVDIMIDQSFDVINAQEEQFNALLQFGANGGIDIIELIEVSSIRNKEDLIEKIEKRRAEAAQAAGSAQQLQAQQIAAETENKQANTAKTMVEAQQKQVETELMIANPDPNPQSVV